MISCKLPVWCSVFLWKVRSQKNYHISLRITASSLVKDRNGNFFGDNKRKDCSLFKQWMSGRLREALLPIWTLCICAFCSHTEMKMNEDQNKRSFGIKSLYYNVIHHLLLGFCLMCWVHASDGLSYMDTACICSSIFVIAGNRLLNLSIRVAAKSKYSRF